MLQGSHFFNLIQPNWHSNPARITPIKYTNVNL